MNRISDLYARSTVPDMMVDGRDGILKGLLKGCGFSVRGSPRLYVFFLDVYNFTLHICTALLIHLYIYATLRWRFEVVPIVEYSTFYT